jgi:hypothetical protein
VFIKSVSIFNFPIKIMIFRMHVGVVIFDRNIFLKFDEMPNTLEIWNHFYNKDQLCGPGPIMGTTGQKSVVLV